jgi:hypothetical protein
MKKVLRSLIQMKHSITRKKDNPKNPAKRRCNKMPPNIPHWQGASANTTFVQVAVTNNHKGATVWLEAVTDEEYNSIK